MGGKVPSSMSTSTRELRKQKQKVDYAAGNTAETKEELKDAAKGEADEGASVSPSDEKSKHRLHPNPHPSNHTWTDKYAGGACLWADQGKKAGKNLISCNYNWQCYHRVKTEDSALYNNKIPSPRPAAPIKVWFTSGEQNLDLTTLADDAWNVGVKTGDKENFCDGVDVPYWHNDHHMIPCGALHRSVQAVAEASENFNPDNVMDTLLLAEYNLNYFKNMIMLPMDPWVASALALPRHLTQTGMMDHNAYSGRVQGELTKIMKKYINKKAGCDPSANLTGLKEDLLDLQDKLHVGIKTAGANYKDVSLDDIAKSHFGF